MLTIEDFSNATAVAAPLIDSKQAASTAVAQVPQSPSLEGTDATHPEGLPWGLADVVLALGVWLFGSFAFGFAAAVACLGMGIKPSGDGFSQIIAIATEFALLGSTLLFSVGKYHVKWQSLGFRRFPVRTLWLAFGGLAAWISIMCIYVVAVSGLHVGFAKAVSNLPAGASSYSGILLFLLFVYLVIAAPLAEETYFRGFLFPQLTQLFQSQEKTAVRKVSSVAVPAILSGFIFAAFHLQLGLLIPFTAAGALLACIYRRSGSLWVNILSHASYNLVILVISIAAHGR